MEKSVFTNDYATFLAHLRRARKQAKLTQEQVARALGQTQSFVSKCERGERRLDIIELYHFCRVIGMPLEEFVKQIAPFLEERHTNV